MKFLQKTIELIVNLLDNFLYYIMQEDVFICVLQLVYSAHSRIPNYKIDFMTLYSITISGRIISKFLGKVVEKIPPISEKQFNELKEADPFEKEKTKKKTFALIVNPSFVMRTIGEETPPALTQKLEHSSVETNATGQSELKIPLSLKNIKTLCSWPLNGKENERVFDRYFILEIFEQCNSCPDKMSVYLMRRDIVEQSLGMQYNLQKELVKAQGFEVPPLRERALFGALVILNERKRFDPLKFKLIASSHPGKVRFRDGDFDSVTVGDFDPAVGVSISVNVYNVHPNIGVVPGRPAEVPATGT